MPGIVLNMEGVATGAVLIPEGEYTVVWTKATLKKTRDQSKDMILVQANIKDADEPDLNGKPVFRNFVLTPEAMWAFKKALVAFDAPDNFVEGQFNTDELVELNGLTAVAIVTQEPDREKPDVMRNVVEFQQEEL